jgi:transposase, IS30 family
MKQAKKLSKAERLEIKILLDKGYSHRAIARVLERSPNTISYEIKVNGGIQGYNPVNAHIYAGVKRRNTRREWSKIQENDHLRTYIIQGLENHQNPDEISGRMRVENTPFYASKTTIYEWLRSIYGLRYCRLLYSGNYYKKKRVTKTERVMIPNRIDIHARPVVVSNRSIPGHWERDTIVSRKGCSGGISVGVERVTRLISAQLVKSMSSKEHMQKIQLQKSSYLTHSITFDNGIENRLHTTLAIPTYFCEPYHSWQKGSVENANKMIRRYFPKGTNFREVSNKRLQEVVTLINNKPRKILNYKTALEAAMECGIIK